MHMQVPGIHILCFISTSKAEGKQGSRVVDASGWAHWRCRPGSAGQCGKPTVAAITAVPQSFSKGRKPKALMHKTLICLPTPFYPP